MISFELIKLGRIHIQKCVVLARKHLMITRGSPVIISGGLEGDGNGDDVGRKRPSNRMQ